MKYQVGFIGCGNMAKAIIGGLVGKAGLEASSIAASDANRNASEQARERFGISVEETNVSLVKNSEIVFLAVKPQFLEAVTEEIRGLFTEEQLVISIAPGKTLPWLADHLGETVKLVRTMPNTPALVGEGITGVCRNPLVSDAEYDRALTLLQSFGIAEDVPERLMDAVVSVSGSSPAYTFLFIEAMADAAVLDGMPRDKAYRFAAQAVLGSARMVLESGKHPGELKDMVCSPGGTTIEAVRVLEEKGFRSAVIEAMQACTKKAKSL